MKKTFVIGALVALAMTLVSCMDGLLADPEPFTVKYKKSAQWSAAELAVDDVKWTSLKLEFDGDEDLYEKVQICLISDKVEKQESWGTAYYSKYVAIPSDGKLTINFAEAFAANDKDDAGKEKADTSLKAIGANHIVKLTIQNKTTEGFKLPVKEATIQKADGYQEAAVFVKDWACEIIK